MHITYNKDSRGFLLYLLLTALVCGGLIMVIEVMGSRVIGPFFGVSLFVWTSLISVTLISLAIGYGVGGLLADRNDSPRILYLLVLAAGVATFIVPLAKAFVLKLTVGLGLKLGAFLSTAILFGPSLFLLGCVSPYLAKIATAQLHNLGKVVGGLYALSTVGSTLGTVLTGFILVAYLGVDEIFLLVGCLLILLSVIYFLVFERKWAATAAILLPFLLYHPSEFTQKELKDGTRLVKIYEAESYYGSVKVVDTISGVKHSRYLMIDNLIQGGMDVSNGLSIFDYSYHLQFLPYRLNPQGQTCLVIGLGIGVVASWYEQQGKVCDVVDIDPNVIEVAKTYFNFRLKGDLVAEDGRYFLMNNGKQYDYIILDVFNGDITPAHMLSFEALNLAKQHLTESGVLGINLIGTLRQNTLMTASVEATLKEVFEQVSMYPAYAAMSDDGVGNIIFTAYMGEPRVPEHVSLDRDDIHPFYRERLRQLGEPFQFVNSQPTIILHDEYNPIDFYDSWLRELIRQRILETTDWDLLVG